MRPELDREAIGIIILLVAICVGTLLLMNHTINMSRLQYDTCIINVTYGEDRMEFDNIILSDGYVIEVTNAEDYEDQFEVGCKHYIAVRLLPIPIIEEMAVGCFGTPGEGPASHYHPECEQTEVSP